MYRSEADVSDETHLRLLSEASFATCEVCETVNSFKFHVCETCCLVVFICRAPCVMSSEACVPRRFV